jgi:hypothetical protein
MISAPWMALGNQTHREKAPEGDGRRARPRPASQVPSVSQVCWCGCSSAKRLSMPSRLLMASTVDRLSGRSRGSSEDSEAVGVLARGLDREALDSGSHPRMDQCRVDPAFVHLLQHVGRREIGDLAVIHVRRLVVLPDVDLRIDDQHVASLPFWLENGAGAMMGRPATSGGWSQPQSGTTSWAMLAISAVMLAMSPEFSARSMWSTPAR